MKEDLSQPAQFSHAELKAFVAAGKTIVDLRDAPSFGAAHIPGSINIGLTPQSVNWLKLVLDPDQEIALLANSKQDIDQAAAQCTGAGYTRLAGYSIGIMEWVFAGEETGFLPQLSIHGLKRVLEKYPDHRVLDVRTDEEWRQGHIAGAVHMPLPQLVKQGLEMDRETHISAVCAAGYRSNIAGSHLKSRGFPHVYSVIGGMNAWKMKFATER
jgi:rhodanese-related sulfurtransferase